MLNGLPDSTLPQTILQSHSDKKYHGICTETDTQTCVKEVEDPGEDTCMDIAILSPTEISKSNLRTKRAGSSSNGVVKDECPPEKEEKKLCLSHPVLRMDQRT